jgi:ubiquinone/menaquinone biosynthesis C-methylase UbiE
MDHHVQKQYFEIAYRTGSDIWTHIPYAEKALSMLPSLPASSLVLDIGSGRGLWAVKLASMGYRVLGMDYLQSVVDQANMEIANRKILDQVRFIQGDVRDIPFTDNSFTLVTDIGVLQHLVPADWVAYVRELSRVTGSGGYVLSVTLSRRTERFLGFTPSVMPEAHVEKFGVSYYFFSNDEITTLFGYGDFEMISQEVEFFDARSDPGDRVALLFSVLRKK